MRSGETKLDALSHALGAMMVGTAGLAFGACWMLIAIHFAAPTAVWAVGLVIWLIGFALWTWSMLRFLVTIRG